ncbi:MAG: hypothetical protein K2W80_18225 [Burkholderiales bacterium]|jgi:hypothetical protein|nr:hypothetical protein [Burkholderiales bacterium]
MQSPSDPDAHAHPHVPPRGPAEPHGHGQPPRPSNAPLSVMPAAVTLPPPSAVPASGPASLFLAGSRDRLLAASGLVAVLWLLVWWALD